MLKKKKKKKQAPQHAGSRSTRTAPRVAFLHIPGNQTSPLRAILPYTINLFYTKMARRSLRKSTAPAGRSASKRPQTNEVTPDAPSKKRTKTAGTSHVKATTLPTRSKYFEPTSDEDIKAVSESSRDENGNSDYEDEDASDSPDSPEDEASDASSVESKPKKRSQPIKSTSATSTRHGRAKDFLKTGADTGFEPGTQVVIKKPKARDDGGIPYVNDAIHPNTMLFLKELAENNDREWLKSKCIYYVGTFPAYSLLYVPCKQEYISC
jgi:hypothetical protein